ncbi:hypothetical protein ABIA25_001624 [Sinorhizobium fredii]|uniref:hypothetical protein n=1 Tax=Rhizobium fredii TaxID=380 RepID=UPI003516ADA8
MSNWSALSLQAVWFTPEARHFKAADVFEAFTGDSPESVQTNKAPTPNNAHLSIATGAFRNVSVRASVQLGRIDVVLEPVASGTEVSPPALIENTEEWIIWLANRSNEQSEKFPAVNRLALVQTLAEMMDSHAAATAAVNDKLGTVMEVDSNVTDLMMQANRRVHSTDPSFALNRLLRFSVMGFQQVSLAFGAPGAVNMVPAVDFYAATQLIDVNTSPTTRNISADEQRKLWDIITREALRLRTDGTLRGLDHDCDFS